jgi:spermidine synthase
MTLDRAQATVLLTSLLVLSACAILYELLISTVSAYLLGSSVLHFSITIGLFLSFLGLGAYLSRFIEGHLLRKFIFIEMLLGLVGGCSAMVLYFGNAWFPNYYVLLLLCVSTIGTLAGMEIPLVTRLLEQSGGGLRDVIARVLAFDYLGALVASVAFPLLLLPLMGSMRTAFFTGLVNWGIGVFNLSIFKKKLEKTGKLWLFAAISGILLVLGFFYSFEMVGFADALNYHDRVVLSRQTPYQKIVVTQWNNDTRLFLNGNLQFSSTDEYRYHECLVHLPLLSIGNRDSVLVLGGGDGIALRHILAHEGVKGIDLVDLDAEMVRLCQSHPVFTRLNQNSLGHPKVRKFYEDAFTYVQHCSKKYNAIIVDLPDPSDPALGKLYSTAFYAMLRQIVALDGVVITQSTSPFLARKPFWCIHATLEAAFPCVVPYQAHVPTFGQWGYNMAFPVQRDTVALVQQLEERLGTVPNLRFLNRQNVRNCFVFDTDVSELPQLPNTLEKMELVDLYSASYWDFH